jgi:hypothetical protein
MPLAAKRAACRGEIEAAIGIGEHHVSQVNSVYDHMRFT